MLSAMMVVYGFVSGGPGARALQLTTPFSDSVCHDSMLTSSSRASLGCCMNEWTHVERRVGNESYLSDLVATKSIDPFVLPCRPAAWRMQLAPPRADAPVIELEDQYVSGFGHSARPCVFHCRVERTEFEQTELDVLSSSHINSISADGGSFTWLTNMKVLALAGVGMMAHVPHSNTLLLAVLMAPVGAVCPICKDTILPAHAADACPLATDLATNAEIFSDHKLGAIPKMGHVLSPELAMCDDSGLRGHDCTSGVA